MIFWDWLSGLFNVARFFLTGGSVNFGWMLPTSGISPSATSSMLEVPPAKTPAKPDEPSTPPDDRDKQPGESEKSPVPLPKRRKGDRDFDRRADDREWRPS